MNDEVISEDIKQFILQNIDSISQWEALRLMHSAPGRKWSPEDIAQSLYIAKGEAAGLLEILSERGFLDKKADRSSLLYRYRPNSSERRRMIDQITALYAKHLIPITHLIHSNSRNRIQKFADAFKIRKD